jgi:Uma2 family endonuclease
VVQVGFAATVRRKTAAVASVCFTVVRKQVEWQNITIGDDSPRISSCDDRETAMSTASAHTEPETFGDLLEQLGGISPHRVRLRPPPGRATEKDLLDVLNHTNRLCELVDGVLVEKVMGYPESTLACQLIKLLGNFLDRHDLGNLAGMDGTLRLMPKLVRIPDVSFVRWEKLPSRQPPAEPIPDLVPDLVVEILSEGNTRGEMDRKLREYFLAGVSLVWFVDRNARTVKVYETPENARVFTENDTLDGGNVLPELSLSVREIFARTPPQPLPARRRTRRRTTSRKKPRPGSGNP